MSQLASFGSALVGGSLIGVAATVLLLGAGRIAGISGVLGGILDPRDGDRGWKWAFLGGLLAGGVALRIFAPATVAFVAPAPLALLVLSGLLVGAGTQLGNGCTSGHGVCGISRLSPRSLAATITFMVTGALAAFAVRHLGGLGS